VGKLALSIRRNSYRSIRKQPQLGRRKGRRRPLFPHAVEIGAVTIEMIVQYAEDPLTGRFPAKCLIGHIEINSAPYDALSEL
jgi:hypothetical protein